MNLKIWIIISADNLISNSNTSHRSLLLTKTKPINKSNKWIISRLKIHQIILKKKTLLRSLSEFVLYAKKNSFNFQILQGKIFPLWKYRIIWSIFMTLKWCMTMVERGIKVIALTMSFQNKFAILISTIKPYNP